MPLFSIVVPTRNRAGLLRYALESALDQTYDDYEIVVSDNSSEDETPEVVHKLRDGRVRYFRTDRVLPMHDSWEFALNKASGEWITFLCDDDALFPCLLQTVAETISRHRTLIVTWQRGIYFLDCFQTPGKRRQLVSCPHTGRTIYVDSQAGLERLFRLDRKAHGLPRMLDSFCHRSLVDDVRSKLGRFFLPPCPDFTCCAAMLASVDRYVLIDKPLALVGCGSHVVGQSATYGRPTRHLAFVEDFHGQCVINRAPLNLLVHTNLIAESLLVVRELMPDRLSTFSLDWWKYFLLNYLELLIMDKRGVDISAERKHFFEMLGRQLRRIQWRVRPFLPLVYATSLLEANAVQRMVASSRFLSYLESVARGRLPVGTRGDLPNILEAVRYITSGEFAGPGRSEPHSLHEG